VAETVVNQGAVVADTSTTRFYFSTNGIARTRLLTGRRPIGSVVSGGSAPGSPTPVTVPSNMAFGTYYLLACADDTGSVTESIETNNCVASGTTVVVGP
jgi:hypothetical protein